MISKSEIKLITSLKQKKYRTSTGLFVAEGPKVIRELMQEGMKLHSLYTTNLEVITSEGAVEISEKELQKISFLTSANTALALFYTQSNKEITSEGLIVALDAVRDPGNLGTIIRLCDWFGVTQLLCSEDSADCYNPKVIQATMGSIARVSLQYTDLAVFLNETKLPVYGGCMNGESVYSEKFPKQGVIVMGNEANGISEKVLKLLTKKITIPQFGKAHKTESLNVATATAILLNEFKRSSFTEM